MTERRITQHPFQHHVPSVNLSAPDSREWKLVETYPIVTGHYEETRSSTSTYRNNEVVICAVWVLLED